MTTLQGKTALVTGASRGIGRATAFALATAGAHVLVHYGRSARDAESLVAGILSKGGRANAIRADLGTPEAATLLAKEVRTIVGANRATPPYSSTKTTVTMEPVGVAGLIESPVRNIYGQNEGTIRVSEPSSGTAGTVSLGGAIVTQTVSGTGQINPDCTGTITYSQTINSQPGPPINITFVVSENGDKIDGLVTDPGAMFARKLLREPGFPANPARAGHLPNLPSCKCTGCNAGVQKAVCRSLTLLRQSDSAPRSVNGERL
jgi:hypothetical protein